MVRGYSLLFAAPLCVALIAASCAAPTPPPPSPAPASPSALARAKKQRELRRVAFAEAERERKARHDEPEPPAEEEPEEEPDDDTPSQPGPEPADAGVDGANPDAADLPATDAAAPPPASGASACRQICERATNCFQEMVAGMPDEIRDKMRERASKLRDECLARCAKADKQKTEKARACLAHDKCEEVMKCLGGSMLGD